MTREPTYQTFILHQLLPAQGYQAVLVDDQGHHWAEPLPFLALITRRTRVARTGELMSSLETHGAYTEEEGREIVGIDYDLGGMGFNPVDQLANYCGLLPSDVTLLDFLAEHHCGQAAKKAGVHAG